MARIKLKIGNTPGVHFNLPSCEYGNSEMCVGRVAIDSGKLKSGGEFSIGREQLRALLICSKSIISSAQGSCRITSKCKMLEIDFSMTLRGHIKIKSKMSGYIYVQPENREWCAESTFYLYPNEMKEVLGCEAAILG